MIVSCDHAITLHTERLGFCATLYDMTKKCGKL